MAEKGEGRRVKSEKIINSGLLPSRSPFCFLMFVVSVCSVAFLLFVLSFVYSYICLMFSFLFVLLNLCSIPLFVPSLFVCIGLFCLSLVFLCVLLIRICFTFDDDGSEDRNQLIRFLK